MTSSTELSLQAHGFAATPAITALCFEVRDELTHIAPRLSDVAFVLKKDGSGFCAGITIEGWPLRRPRHVDATSEVLYAAIRCSAARAARVVRKARTNELRKRHRRPANAFADAHGHPNAV